MRSRIALRWRVADTVILAVCLGLAVLPLSGDTDDRPGSVFIDCAGRVWRYDLPARRVVEIPAKNGTFRLRIDGYSVAVVETHCPDGFCRRMGPVDRVGQTLVCVPQQIEVRIDGEKSGVDAVCR